MNASSSKMGPGNPAFDEAVRRLKVSVAGEGRKPAKRASERPASIAKVTPKAKALSATRRTNAKKQAG